MVLRKIASAIAALALTAVFSSASAGAEELSSPTLNSLESIEQQAFIEEGVAPDHVLSELSEEEVYDNQDEIYAVTVFDENISSQSRAASVSCTATRKISCGVYSATINYIYRPTNSVVGSRHVIVNTRVQMQARTTRVSASTYLIVTRETGTTPPDAVEVLYNRTAPGTSVSYPASREPIFITVPPPGSNVSASTQPTLSIPNTALGAEGHMVGISFKSSMEATEKTFWPQSSVRCAYITDRIQNCVNAAVTPTVSFSSTTVPHIVSNISTAFGEGHPRILTKNETTAANANRDVVCPQSQIRRLELLGSPPEGMVNPSCDEYPFASSEEGGANARVQWVPLRENSSQGGMLSSFYTNNQVATGEKFGVGVS